MTDEFDEEILPTYKNFKLPDVLDAQKIEKLLLEIYSGANKNFSAI